MKTTSCPKVYDISPELANQIIAQTDVPQAGQEKIHELKKRSEKKEEAVNVSGLKIPSANEMRKKTFSNKALEYCIQLTVQNIENCAKLGKTYAPMITAYMDKDRNNMLVDVGKEAVLKELAKYGYREYTEPVIIGGVRQTDDFVTWF